MGDREVGTPQPAGDIEMGPKQEEGAGGSTKQGSASVRVLGLEGS